MRTYEHIISAVRDRPWAVLPSVLVTIRGLLHERAQGIVLSEEEVQARLQAARDEQGDRKGRQQANGVAILPVYGTIFPKAGLMADMSGGTSVEAFSQQFRSALANPDVASIVLDVDSPGGLTDMVPEMAAELRAAKGQKPVVAVANTLMASAAYWLGSQADEIIASPSSMVGSIGVYAAHDDLSAAYEKAGIKTTLVSAGKYKTEGNDLGPLDEDARAHVQAVVDEAYDQFLADVAKGRGVTVKAVRSGYGEGRVLTAQQAKAAGMVDRIGTLDETVARLLKAPRKGVQKAWAEGFTATIAESKSGPLQQIDAFAREAAKHFVVDNPEAEDAGEQAARFEFERELYERRR